MLMIVVGVCVINFGRRLSTAPYAFFFRMMTGLVCVQVLLTCP